MGSSVSWAAEEERDYEHVVNSCGVASQVLSKYITAFTDPSWDALKVAFTKGLRGDGIVEALIRDKHLRKANIDILAEMKEYKAYCAFLS